jgi:hypothetical protein
MVRTRVLAGRGSTASSRAIRRRVSSASWSASGVPPFSVSVSRETGSSMRPSIVSRETGTVSVGAGCGAASARSTTSDRAESVADSAAAFDAGASGDDTRGIVEPGDAVGRTAVDGKSAPSPSSPSSRADDAEDPAGTGASNAFVLWSFSSTSGTAAMSCAPAPSGSSTVSVRTSSGSTSALTGASEPTSVGDSLVPGAPAPCWSTSGAAARAVAGCAGLAVWSDEAVSTAASPTISRMMSSSSRSALEGGRGARVVAAGVASGSSLSAAAVAASQSIAVVAGRFDSVASTDA